MPRKLTADEVTKRLQNSTEINRDTFPNKSALSEVEIPNSVTAINDGSFRNCKELGKITFQEDCQVSIIRMSAFSGSCITEMEYPKSCDYVAPYLFFECTKLKNITLHDNIKEIDDGAFASCTALNEINIPDSCTKIGKNAFKDCTNLKSLIIPEGAKTSDGKLITAKYLGLDNTNCKLQVKLGKDTINSVIAKNHSYQTNKIHKMDFHAEATSYINTEHQYDNVTEIEIPDSIAELGNYSFTHFANLKKITLHDNITKIGEGAFDHCKNLTEFTYPKNCTSVESDVFYGCTNLKKVTFSPDVKTIPKNFFETNISLKEINIPQGATFKDGTEITNENLNIKRRSEFQEDVKINFYDPQKENPYSKETQDKKRSTTPENSGADQQSRVPTNYAVLQKDVSQNKSGLSRKTTSLGTQDHSKEDVQRNVPQK